MKKILLGWCFLAGLEFAFAGPMRETDTFKDVSYSTQGHVRQKLDLYVPRTGAGPFPLIIWIHGGGWQSGDKANCPPYQKKLTDLGFAVASINYRLSSDAIFPAQIQDVKAAIRYLRAHAVDYKLDSSRFGVWGASAGGHLAALVGTTEDSDFLTSDHPQASSAVQAVVDFFGPTNFQLMAETPRYESHALAGSPESKLLGGAVFSLPDAVKAADPISYVSADDPSFFILHGDADPVVPFNQSEALSVALKAKSVPCELRILSGAGHGGAGFEAPSTTADIVSFFKKAFGQ